MIKIGNSPLQKQASNASEMVDVEFFDPPMCCPTGVCGPTIDQTLLDMNEMIMKLQADGYRVERYQMSSNPGAFISNPEVMKLVREKQMDALPITVIQGIVIKEGQYPTIQEIYQTLRKG
jgi:hypothetical protein